MEHTVWTRRNCQHDEHANINNETAKDDESFRTPSAKAIIKLYEILTTRRFSPFWTPQEWIVKPFMIAR